MTHIISYGGGVNSTALTIWMLQQGKPIDYIVFCDTGAELPETLEYVNTFGQWLKQHKLQIKTIARKEGLYDYCKRLRIIPFRQFRWCTDKFKVRPFTTFCKEHLPVTAYIGFDAGEESRVLNSESPIKGRKCRQEKAPYGKRYPLYQNGIDRNECLKIIAAAGLPPPPKSGCFFCPFITPRAYQQMKIIRPELFKKAMELEQMNHAGKFLLQTVSLSEIWNQQEMQLCDYDIELPCGCFDGSHV